MTQTTIQYIIAEGLDVNFYSSKHRAENSIEALDLETTDYIGFDNRGRLLKIVPNGSIVSIFLAEDEPSDSGQLASLLKRFLVAVGKPPDTDDLRDLLCCCEQYVDSGW